MSKEIIDRMRELRKELDNEPRIVTVTKLGPGNDGLNIYVWPVTTKQYQKILHETDRIDAAVVTILQRACDKDGKQLFPVAERGEIVTLFGPKLILKIATKINEDLNNLDDETGIDILGN